MELFGLDLVTLIGAVVTIASVIVAATPTPKDDSILKSFYNIIEILALNIGKAKDK